MEVMIKFHMVPAKTAVSVAVEAAVSATVSAAVGAAVAVAAMSVAVGDIDIVDAAVMQ